MEAPTFDDRIRRLTALAKEPERLPMGRSEQWPTMAAKHIANEREIVTLREALAEALSLINALRYYRENE